MKLKLITLLLVLNCGACSQNHINYKYWDNHAHPDHFPEIHSHTLAVPWLKDKKSLGLVFSGGGTRSAAATLGQLRALKQSGILDQARYISAVSGGSWASVPYTFLPEDNTKCRDDLISEATFLGKYVSPENLNENNLTNVADKTSLAYAIANTYGLFFKTIASLATGSGDEAFAKGLSSAFLKPFCLNDERYITSHEEALVEFQNQNPNFSSEDFYVARRDNPYLIVGTSFLARNTRQKILMYPVEITPLYSGLRELITGHPIPFIGPDYVVGGTYVETIGYDAKYSKHLVPESELIGTVTGTINRPRYIFTLADTIAASGAAPVSTAPAITQGIGFPEFRHWSSHQDKRGQYALDFQHGDGGHVDNIGIIPLLARKVDSILVFVNTRSRIVNFDDETKKYKFDGQNLYPNLKAYFKKDPVNYPYAHVFESRDVKGKKALKVMKAEFENDVAQGKPLVHCNQYKVKSNSAFGIEVDNNYQPKVCWFYLGLAENWIKQVSKNEISGKTKSDLISLKGDFKNFPHYKTFFENKPAIVDLTYPQVNALSNFTAWSVCEGLSEVSKTLSVNDKCK